MAVMTLSSTQRTKYGSKCCKLASYCREDNTAARFACSFVGGRRVWALPQYETRRQPYSSIRVRDESCLAYRGAGETRPLRGDGVSARIQVRRRLPCLGPQNGCKGGPGGYVLRQPWPVLPEDGATIETSKSNLQTCRQPRLGRDWTTRTHNNLANTSLVRRPILVTFEREAHHPHPRSLSRRRRLWGPPAYLFPFFLGPPSPPPEIRPLGRILPI